MKVLVVYYGNKTTFIQRDIDILSKHFDVDEISIRRAKDIFSLGKKIKNSDVVFIWFAGKHAGISVFLAKLFGKKSVVVVGGYDAAKVPEIDYGLWAVGSFWDKTLAKYALNKSDKVLVVDTSLKRNLIKNAKIKGYNIEYVPTGYDPNFWKPKGEKKNIVLSVAGAKNIKRVKLKGLDTFVKAAKYVPNAKFVVIGIEGEARKYLEKIAPKNVKIIGYLKNEMLLPYYQKAKVYAQLSLSEGLPNALCEAMLAGAIPVGTNRGGIPEAMGNIGFYVPYGDVKATARAIKEALTSPEELGLKARNRILKLFPTHLREHKIISILKHIVNSGEVSIYD